MKIHHEIIDYITEQVELVITQVCAKNQNYGTIQTYGSQVSHGLFQKIKKQMGRGHGVGVGDIARISRGIKEIAYGISRG